MLVCLACWIPSSFVPCLLVGSGVRTHGDGIFARKLDFLLIKCLKKLANEKGSMRLSFIITLMITHTLSLGRRWIRSD